MDEDLRLRLPVLYYLDMLCLSLYPSVLAFGWYISHIWDFKVLSFLVIRKKKLGLLMFSIPPVHPCSLPHPAFQKGLSHCTASYTRSHLVERDVQLLQHGVSAWQSRRCRQQKDEFFLPASFQHHGTALCSPCLFSGLWISTTLQSPFALQTGSWESASSSSSVKKEELLSQHFMVQLHSH